MTESGSASVGSGPSPTRVVYATPSTPLGIRAAAAGAQDLEFIAALERAQFARPRDLTWKATAGHVRREGAVEHIDFTFRLNLKNQW